MKAVRPVIASNGVPNLQMTSVGSHRTSGREKEGRIRSRENTSHISDIDKRSNSSVGDLVKWEGHPIQ